MILNEKQLYTNFCREHTDIPIFSQPWWLDVVCPNQWDVILIKKNNEIIASFPYYKTKIKKYFTNIGMPPLTQKLGPYIIYNNNFDSYNKRISYEHRIYSEIIDKLPKIDSISINFDNKYKNWLPFYWQGFKQSTKYTYILENIDNYNNIYQNYSKRKKRLLEKSKNQFTLKFDLPKKDFYLYYYTVIKNRNDKMLFSQKLFERLYDTIYQNNAGRVFYCIDVENNIHAICFIIWDYECAYYLLTIRHKLYNTSGGTEFLVNEVIKYVSSFVKIFDFEGSMINGVEESYRQYGTKQIEYYSISKYNNLILRLLRAINNE